MGLLRVEDMQLDNELVGPEELARCGVMGLMLSERQPCHDGRL
jgi:hypothetical protein